VCWPSLGAGRRSAPGVSDRRGSMWQYIVHRDAPHLIVRDIDENLALLHVSIGKALGKIAVGDEVADWPFRLSVIG
jgi:hypothetical protein